MSQVNPQDLSMEDLAAALSGVDVEAALEPSLRPAQLKAIYRRVHRAIEAGNHAEAVDEAFVLVSNDPWERDYQLALAACLHHLEQYESAGRSYAIALLLDATDALCAYRIGECLGALGHFADAREAFEAAEKLSWLDPQYAEVRAHTLLRLEELTRLETGH